MPAFSLIFLAPDPFAFQSGGNIYNFRLMEALQRQGADVRREEPNSLQKREGVLIVDTLYMEDFDPAGWPGKALLLVHHLQSLYPPEGWDGEGWFREKEAPYLQKYDGFLTTSAFAARYLRERGMEGPILAIPPALEFQPEITACAYPPIRAVIAANLVERKGIGPFLEALLRRAPWKQTYIQLMGSRNLEPIYANHCLNLLTQLQGLVEYRGELPQQSVYEAYGKSNLLISPSYMETYGMVMQEAAARGLPILAYRGGNAAAHIWQGYNGYLCDTHEEMAACLKRWEGQPSELKRLSKGAREMARQVHYSWEEAAGLLWKGLNG